MDKQNIEEILARVRAVEARDKEAGIVIRRVVERAEDNWNAHPETDNASTVVRKMISPEDLRTAAEQLGVAGDKNVIAFAKMIEALPAPPAVAEPSAAEQSAAKAESDAAEKARTIAAEQLIGQAFSDADAKTVSSQGSATSE